MAHGSRPENSGSDAEGRYANYFKAGHNAFEVVLEFAQFYEGDERPRYAKTFLEVLRVSLERYESVYGPLAAGKPHE